MARAGYYSGGYVKEIYREILYCLKEKHEVEGELFVLVPTFLFQEPHEVYEDPSPQRMEVHPCTL